MSTASTDEGFHEIQLSGKQLVFLFMAVTVVSVVIFLMGVLVGRGVQSARGLPGVEAESAQQPSVPPATAGPGTSTTPTTAGENLTYANRLNASGPAAEALKAPEPPPTVKEPVATSPAPAAAAPAPGDAPASDGAYSIQVAALAKLEEAETIASRLASKGYAAYVVPPASGAPSVFRVRVGKFKDRREADPVAARLQKEEQFKPWIVR
jgi:cell division septation protein DedD